jgi:GT2 family glycosyltransferase
MAAGGGAGEGSVRTGAVVVSYESRLDLRSCIEKLLEQRPVPQVVVVDNASSDGSADLVRERFGDRVSLLALADNTGFAGACNRGLAAFGPEIGMVAFMNPDVRVQEGCLAACAETLAADPAIGGIAPRLMRPEGQIVDSVGQVLRRGTLEVRDRGYGEPLGPELLEERPVLAACGALAVYRREALAAVSSAGCAWAEELFCFWEDLELGWRMTNQGWRVQALPSATAVHGRGAGARRGRGPLRWRRPVELEACVISNRWITLLRHLHRVDLMQRAPVLLAWDLMMTKLSVLRRPRLLAPLRRRWPLVTGEWRARGTRPQRRLVELPW